jgi:hypothetical protein
VSFVIAAFGFKKTVIGFECSQYFPFKVTGEKSSVRNGDAGRRNPFPLDIVHELASRVHFNGKLAQKRVGGPGHLCFDTQRILKDELHVGLTGGDPDFTDHDVGKSQFVFARNRHFKRAGCGVLQIE